MVGLRVYARCLIWQKSIFWQMLVLTLNYFKKRISKKVCLFMYDKGDTKYKNNSIIMEFVLGLAVKYFYEPK